MPERETIERAREDAREGQSPSTQAGEFVREEVHHIREGKHGAASTKQASLTMPALSSTFFPHCCIHSEMSAISLS